MQRKRNQRRLQPVRKSSVIRSRKGRVSICQPAGEKTDPKKIIAHGLFALNLSELHSLEVYPLIGGRFNYEKADKPSVILEQIIPAYKRIMCLLGCEPRKIKRNDPFEVERILEDINSNWGVAVS